MQFYEGTLEGEKPKPYRAFLWRASRPGRAPSYLFGTMHCSIPLNVVLGSRGLRYIDAARCLCVESDFSDTDELRASYSDLSPGQKRSKRGRLIRSLVGADGAMESFIGGGMMDAALTNRAKEGGMRVVGLETITTQVLQAVDSLIGMGVTAAAIDRRVASGDMRHLVLPPMLDNMYRLGNVKVASSLIGLGIAANPTLSSLVSRHGNWLPAIRRELSKGNAFIAVGLAHLVGHNSLASMLRKVGYRVKRI